jgi:putative nucleotidyltransferase with HDIG domain
MKMRKIYLLRHGKVDTPDGRRMCIGQMDVPLSGLGRLQAEELGRYFQGKRISAVFSSPLSRCVETAEQTAGGREVNIADRLAEIDVGEWDGLSFDEIRERWPELYAKRENNFDKYAPPGGETFAHALERAKPAFEEILQETTGDIVIVAHAGINRLLLCEYTNTPLSGYFGFPQPYGCINILETQSGAVSMKSVGKMPTDYPNDSECRLIMEEAGVPQNVISHCEAVASYAGKLAQALEAKGHSIDKRLLRSAALLHDIARLRPDHARAGANALRKAGYPKVAAIVESHHSLDCPRLDEASILFYADKRVQGNKLVSLDERFAASRAKCSSPKAIASHERQYEAAKAVAGLLFNEGIEPPTF